MFKKITAPIIVAALILVPTIAGAQTKDLRYVIDLIIFYLNQILVLLIGLAVVMFVWYVIQYFIKADADRTEAAKYVMYSLIGFFVILSFWGLVNILQNTFGLKNENNQPASWTSFKGLFPGGSSNIRPSSGSTNTFTPSFNATTNTYTPSYSGTTNTRTPSSNGTTNTVTPRGR